MKISINNHYLDTSTATHYYQGLNIWNGREFVTINSTKRVLQTLYRSQTGKYFLVDYPRSLTVPPSAQQISPLTARTWLEINDFNNLDEWPSDLVLIAAEV